jgi:diketogulonate reductase-like aldo/keto reductase
MFLSRKLHILPLNSTSIKNLQPFALHAMASTSTTSRQHIVLPGFTYGTAWKKDQTKRLVKEAVSSGFRRIDTAAQPRHYQENLVGEALRELYAERVVIREDLHVSTSRSLRCSTTDVFKLQTKFTQPAGEDLSNMPYDHEAPLDVQIRISIASSLRNLRPTSKSSEGSYVDSLLLHSPLPTIEQNLQAWNLLESYIPHQIRTLGISNVTLPTLQAIFESSTIKPSIVQNRFYPNTRYDVPLRAFCREHDILYQSFWTLTGNPDLLNSEPVDALITAAQISRAVALYALVSGLGIEVLNGTTSKEHMSADLGEMIDVYEWASANANEWNGTLNAFQDLVGDDRR